MRPSTAPSAESRFREAKVSRGYHRRRRSPKRSRRRISRILPRDEKNVDKNPQKFERRPKSQQQSRLSKSPRDTLSWGSQLLAQRHETHAWTRKVGSDMRVKDYVNERLSRVSCPSCDVLQPACSALCLACGAVLSRPSPP